MKPFIVGITGGIASGKSVVSAVIQSLGGEVIDADVISREVVRKGTKGYERLKVAFPEVFHDDELDRKALREIVFNDERAREKLNEITHPLIEERTLELIRSSTNGVVYLVVPLMFESNFDKFCDYTITICAKTPKRVEWIKARNGEITDALAIKMINSQTSDELRNARADEVVYNDGTLDDLKEKAKILYRKFLKNKN